METGVRRWVGSVLPALAEGTVVAIEGKASRRSKMTGQQAWHLVSAFATEAQLILGQETCAAISNELTAIPVLLEALLLKGAIVTIDAMGTHSNIAQAIRDKEAERATNGKTSHERRLYIGRIAPEPARWPTWCGLIGA